MDNYERVSRKFMENIYYKKKHELFQNCFALRQIYLTSSMKNFFLGTCIQF